MTAHHADGFATTRWTLVNAAGTSTAAARDALAALCQIYWPPLYGFLRRRGHPPDQAEDLIQGFFARMLEREDFLSADPARGRFRAYVLTALKRYAINEYDRARTRKRGGRTRHLALDVNEAERTYALALRDDDTPERVFNRKWAGITLDRALARLRQELRQAGKDAHVRVLVPYLTDAEVSPPYREVAAALGMSEGAVKVAVHRLRQRFGAILRDEIAETVLTREQLDDEVRELIRAMTT